MKKNKLIEVIDENVKGKDKSFIKIGDDLIPLDSLKAWSIIEEGKLNKNNIIFQDKIYKKLSEELKKINDELIENRKSLKLEQEKREEK